MASPPATAPCTASRSFRHRPHIALLLLAALLAAPRPTRSWSSNGAAPPPTETFFCSGQSPAAAVTSGELANFLDTVCAGAYGAADMSHSMSVHVAENRTMYMVAQCRPDVAVPDCRACLAAASSRLVAGAAAAAAAVWHDACFLRYSVDDGPNSRLFREDEPTATVFSASRLALSPREVDGGRAAVRRLLAAVTRSAMSSHHMCRGVGAGTASPSVRRRRSAGGGGLIYGLRRCAPGVSCDDCRRCLRGALVVAEREYNGSAGMQVLRLSCMARYESYPFYNATSIWLQLYAPVRANVSIGGHVLQLNPAAQPTPAPPGGHTPQPPVAAQPPPPPSTSSIKWSSYSRWAWGSCACTTHPVAPRWSYGGRWSDAT